MKKVLIFQLLIVIAFVADAQEYYTGCLIDDEAYSQIPLKARQLTRSYAALPQRASLLEYCPTPGNQGAYGTCTSWAIAYAARTIMEAQLNGCTNPVTNAERAFSPTFVYYHIKKPSDYNCQSGSCINDGLDLLKKQGVPRKSIFYEDCASSIPSEAYNDAKQYRIEDYFILFECDASNSKKVESTKLALSQGKPVIISMSCYTSFSSAKEVWNGVADNHRGYHCMCVVGYDDEVYGGAFKIMNSWGIYWGDNGFTWVKYSDYGKYVRYGCEMYLGKKAPKPNSLTLSGSMSIKLATGETMSAKLSTENGIQVYKVGKSYPSGTRYRILLSNNEPAYVYVLGSDNTANPELLFPPTPSISPALIYSTNNIAIPDENWYIETDQTIGTDYLCVLYSQTELPIAEIVSGIRTGQGSFTEKLFSVLGSSCIPNPDISFNQTEISFSTSSRKTVVPIIVEIPHNR